MYLLNWKNLAVDPLSKASISVPVGTVNTTSTDLSLTGKGAANYGALQQENFLRLLENFADTAAPANPTIGQLWYDHSVRTLKVLTSKSPITWKSLAGVQVTAAGAAPTPAALGDIWFEQTGPSSGFLYVYTGIGRYPTTATTIGGWDQIWPNVTVYAGREEYDQLRNLVDLLIGMPIGTRGSGALGKSIDYLTNFAALDQDLRSKVAVLGADNNTLISTAGDTFITEQAPNTTLFYGLDTSSSADGFFFGVNGFGVPMPNQSGTIIVNGVSTTVATSSAANTLNHHAAGDYFICWNIGASPFVIAAINRNFALVRFNNGVWEYDTNTTTWQAFTPTADHYIIGRVSKSRADDNIYPGDEKSIVWAEAVPMLGAKRQHLKVEPNSQDWDLLLSAARYALNRLELPNEYYNLISEFPFVTDGRQAPAVLTSLPTTDIRYPSGHRRANRKVGIVTQVQGFTETVNAVTTGIANRFSLKGINGSTGTNSNFAATTSTAQQYTVTAVSAEAAAGTGSLRLRLRFPSANEKYGFVGSGGAVELVMSHDSGTSTAGDLALQSLMNLQGVVRITGDKTRFFGSSLPRTISAPSQNIGLQNAHTTGLSATVTSTSGAASFSITLFRSSVTDPEPYFDVLIDFAAGSAITGQTTITANVIYDNEQTGALVDVYPRPLPFVAGDVIDSL